MMQLLKRVQATLEQLADLAPESDVDDGEKAFLRSTRLYRS